MRNLYSKLSGATTAAGIALATATPAFAAITSTEINPGTGFAGDIGKLMNAVLRFVMVIAIFLVFFYLIWGGIQWITSGGDKGKTEEARNKITAAVIGLIVLAASWAILLVVLNFLGFSGISGVLQQEGLTIN